MEAAFQVVALVAEAVEAGRIIRRDFFKREKLIDKNVLLDVFSILFN